MSSQYLYVYNKYGAFYCLNFRESIKMMILCLRFKGRNELQMNNCVIIVIICSILS